MAYAAAAVSSVMQSLDYLLHFSRMVLRVKKFQIETFIEKGRVLIRLFEEFSSLTDQSHRAQLVEPIHLTIIDAAGTLEIEDFFDATEHKRVAVLREIVKKLAFDISRGKGMICGEIEESEYVLEVHKALEEMDLVEVELQKFVVKCPEMSKDNFPDPVGNLDYMFSAIAKLKLDTTFVHKEATKGKGLFQDLSFFKAFFRDTTNIHTNQGALKNFEKCMSVMASRAEDFIEEKLLDISLRSKLDSLISMESMAEDLDKMSASLEAEFDPFMLMARRRAEDSVEENMVSGAEDFVEEKLLDTSAEAELNPLVFMASRGEDYVVENMSNKEEDFVEENELDSLLQSDQNSSMSMISGEEDAFESFVRFGNVLEMQYSYLSGPLTTFGEEFFQPMLDSPLKFDLDPLLSIIEITLNEIFHNENGILPIILSKFQEIESLKEKVKTMYDETPDIESSQSSSFLTEVSIPPFVKNDMEVGLEDISNEILDRMTIQLPRLEVLTIVGMGGIGKTTLARRVYNHPSAVYHFHCRAWTAVSQVYQVRDLLIGLLRSVTQLTDEIYKMSKEQLAEYLYKRLKGRRYLIVMDDVWSFTAWDDVRRIFPDDRNGSRILLTSRLKSVAHDVNPRIPPYCMSLLGLDESWKLLKQKVFGKGSCPPELVDCGKHIAKQCQGLPLAIIVVAGYLSRTKRTYECWKDTAATVSSLVITDPEEYLEILALSYNRLPHHLKACFLYMGAFPEHWKIDVQKLINLWIAEGLLDLNYSKRLEEVGEDCLNDLVDRGLVLIEKMSSGGKIKTCRIHDLLRELCLREAQREKFMQVIKRDSHGFPADLNDKHLLSFHLEFHGDVYLLPSLPLTRSFLCFSSGCFFSADIFFLHLRFKLLRVLDISYLNFDHFPAQILDLVLLRYLELTVTHEVPQQLSLLKNLCALVIHGSLEHKQRRQSLILLLEYWNMPWLRHMYISITSSLRYPSLPKGHLTYPSTSSSLQTLSTIRFGSCNRDTFRAMPYLKKLGLCETKDDFYSPLSSRFLHNLVYLNQLEILKCSFYMERKRLKQHRFISEMTFPLSIRQLTLNGSFLPWEDMAPISRLPNLEMLKLKNYAFQGKEWSPDEDGFSRLKHLLIDKTDLEDWKASSIHFPVLQHLVLRSCNFLKEIPLDVGEIPTLEVIELHYCSKSAEVSAEEIRSEVDGIQVHIRSSQSEENHLKRTLSSVLSCIMKSR